MSASQEGLNIVRLLESGTAMDLSDIGSWIPSHHDGTPLNLIPSRNIFVTPQGLDPELRNHSHADFRQIGGPKLIWV